MLAQKKHLDFSTPIQLLAEEKELISYTDTEGKEELIQSFKELVIFY